MYVHQMNFMIRILAGKAIGGIESVAGIAGKAREGTFCQAGKGTGCGSKREENLGNESFGS